MPIASSRARNRENIELDDSIRYLRARTEDGKTLLIEQKQRNQFKEKFHSFRRMWLRIYKEMDEDLYGVNLRLFESVEEISTWLKEDPSTALKVKEVLERAIVEIEEIGKQQVEDAHH